MIYYAEDDENIRELVVYTLSQMGLTAAGFENADEFYRACGERLPELVLLDIMLPNEDGISVLKRLRAEKRTAGIPVIMVTAKGAEYDKVQGLELGADDYIVKPFGMAEMVARIKAVLRRAAPEESAVRLTEGGLILDTKAHLVTVNGEHVTLTFKEYELLQYLMKNKGAAFTREQLLAKIWDYGYEGGTRTVDVHIQTLRGKLKDYGKMIETVRGVGYRFGGN